MIPKKAIRIGWSDTRLGERLCTASLRCQCQMNRNLYLAESSDEEFEKTVSLGLLHSLTNPLRKRLIALRGNMIRSGEVGSISELDGVIKSLERFTEDET